MNLTINEDKEIVYNTRLRINNCFANEILTIDGDAAKLINSSDANNNTKTEFMLTNYLSKVVLIRMFYNQSHTIWGNNGYVGESIDSDHEAHHFTLVKVKKENKGCYYIKNKNRNLYLLRSADDNKVTTNTDIIDDDPRFLWYFTITEDVKNIIYKLDMTALENQMKEVQPTIVSTVHCQAKGTEYNNQSTLQYVINKENSLQSTTGFSVTVGYEYTIGIEDIIQEQQKFSLSINTSFSTSNTSSISFTHTISNVVNFTVPAHTNKRAVLMLKQKDINIPYEAKVHYKNGKSHTEYGTYNGLCYTDITVYVEDY